jgi:hypothetical protein
MVHNVQLSACRLNMLFAICCFFTDLHPQTDTLNISEEISSFKLLQF